MIGEKIKFGFDGTAVKKGLAGIMSGFSKLSKGAMISTKKINSGVAKATRGFRGLSNAVSSAARSMKTNLSKVLTIFNKFKKGVSSIPRQVGIGVARQAGASIYARLEQAVTAIPRQIKEVARFNKEIENLGISTGVAARKYIALGDAITETTGKSSEEAGDFLRDVSERLGEAATDFESTPRKAMVAMGLSLQDIQGKDITGQMEMIAQRFREFERIAGPEKAMFQINELLGEVGKQMIPLFKNYSIGMESAERRTKGLADIMKRLKPELNALFSIGNVLSRKFKEFSLLFLEQLKVGLGGLGLELADLSQWLDKVLDFSGASKSLAGFFIEVMKWFKDTAQKLADGIANAMAEIKNEGLWAWIKGKLGELVTWIGDGIANAISGALKKVGQAFTESGVSPMSLLMGKQGAMDKFLTELNKPTESTGKMETADIAKNTNQTNVILEQIKNKGLGGVFS